MAALRSSRRTPPGFDSGFMSRLFGSRGSLRARVPCEPNKAKPMYVGMARKKRQGETRNGTTRQGDTRQGKTRRGRAKQYKARQGTAKKAKARQGTTRQGNAIQGKVRLDKTM